MNYKEKQRITSTHASQQASRYIIWYTCVQVLGYEALNSPCGPPASHSGRIAGTPLLLSVEQPPQTLLPHCLHAAAPHWQPHLRTRQVWRRRACTWLCQEGMPLECLQWEAGRKGQHRSACRGRGSPGVCRRRVTLPQLSVQTWHIHLAATVTGSLRLRKGGPASRSEAGQAERQAQAQGRAAGARRGRTSDSDGRADEVCVRRERQHGRAAVLESLAVRNGPAAVAQAPLQEHGLQLQQQPYWNRHCDHHHHQAAQARPGQGQQSTEGGMAL